MRNGCPRKLGFVLVGLFLAGSALAAGHRLPDRFVPGSLDRDPVVVEDAAAGMTWSAWAYRNGAEYDLAVSWLDASGQWSEPEFFGVDDDLDQFDPALTVDRNGVVYLAFVERDGNSVYLAVRRGLDEPWVGPHVAVRAEDGASSPALRQVGDRMVLAFRDGDQVSMVDFDLVPSPVIRTFGIQEGPDVIDPLGREITADNDEFVDPGEDGEWKDARDARPSRSQRFGQRNDADHESRDP
jgi:hypothetical protein